MPLKIRRDFAQKPQGGHHFIEDGVLLRGRNADEVIAQIGDQRARKGKPLGDPEQELAEHYQSLRPNIVRNTNEGRTENEQLRISAAEFLMVAWSMRPEKDFHPERTNKRLDICLTCPCRSETGMKDQGSGYIAQADAKGALIAKDANYMDHGICTHHKWPIGVGRVLAEPEKLGLPNAPECCWVPET